MAPALRIVKYDEKSDASSIDMSCLVPAAYLSPKASYIDAYRDERKIRALVGIQLGGPHVDCKAVCRPDEGITITPSVFDFSLLEGYELSEKNITAAQLASSVKSVVKDEIGFQGIVAFDFMREEPPQGLQHLLDRDINVYAVFLKEPAMDWPKVFPQASPSPYSSLRMRMNVAAYAISNPELFFVRKVISR